MVALCVLASPEWLDAASDSASLDGSYTPINAMPSRTRMPAAHLAIKAAGLNGDAPNFRRRRCLSMEFCMLWSPVFWVIAASRLCGDAFRVRLLIDRIALPSRDTGFAPGWLPVPELPTAL